MPDEGLRFEAYSMPHVGALTRKFDLSKWVESYSLNDRFNDLSDGTLSMPDDFPLKTTLFYVDEANHANDAGSMIRVLRGATPIMHYLVTRSEDSWSDGEPTHKLSLEGLEWILDRVLVPNYDHPADPTVEPDWIYGAPSILANTDLENVGFSNLLIHVWVQDTVTAGTWTMTFSGQTTSALAWDIDAPALQTAIEALSNIVDISITGAGSDANPWIIEVIDPDGTDFNVSRTDTLTGGTSQILSMVQGGAGIVDPWSRSFNPLTGLYHGTYTNFQTSTTQAHGGTTSLYVKGALGAWPDSYPGAQQIVSVTGGRTYRAKVWVYPKFARTYRFVIRTTDETYIGAVETALTANSWQEMTMSVTIPDHVRSIIFRLACVSNTDGHEFYLDDALLAPGFDAATLGKMLSDVRTAAIAVGSPLSWLTPTWTTTVDSDGAAWDSSRQWNVNHGQTFLQLIEYARKWNYEFRIRWDAGDSRFEWDMWNPSGGGQTRAGISITGKSGVMGSAPIVRRPPGATYLKTEGALGHWGEYASTTLDDVWGRLEKFYQDRQGVDSTELDTLAQRIVTKTGENTASRSITVSDPVLLPWSSYEPGDTLNLNLAPKDVQRNLRVAAIVAKMGPSDAAPQYDVHFGSPVYSDEAAMAQGLRTLLREFRKPTTTPHTDGAPVTPVVALGGSAPTIVIAASNSSDSSKARADFICSGTNDHLMFQTAVHRIVAGGGGRLLITEGIFSMGGTVDIPATASVRFEGMGAESTQLVMAAAANAYMFRAAGSYSGTLEFASLEMDGTDTTQTSGTWAAIVLQSNSTGSLRVDQCVIHDFRGYGIYSDRSALSIVITNNEISGCTLSGLLFSIEGRFVVSGNYIHSNTEYGVKADGASNLKLVDNWIYSNTLDGYSAGGVSQGSGVVIVGNHFISNRSGVAMEGYDSLIAGNFLGTNTVHGISVGSVRNMSIVGNVSYANTQYGINLVNSGSGTFGGVCSENAVTLNGQHGIYVDGEDWLVEGNRVESNSQTTDNTYDGIHLTASADTCSVLCNMIRTVGPANQHRYSINIAAAGATNNWVAGNYGLGGNTGEYNNAGTGTINVWAGTYGDNY